MHLAGVSSVSHQNSNWICREQILFGIIFIVQKFVPAIMVTLINIVLLPRFNFQILHLHTYEVTNDVVDDVMLMMS